MSSHKLKNMTDLDLAAYIYWEYSAAVLLVTEIIRQLSKGSTNKIIQTIVVDSPKWLSLIIATFLAILDWTVFGNGREFHFWQFVISFGLCVLGYDYGIKLIKDMFTKKPTT